MRTRLWSAAASVVLLGAAPILLTGPAVQAADSVTMGSTADPYAFKFFPAEITVQVGSTVAWQNLSDLQHDASADNGAFKSELLNKGEKFEFKFTAPGDYSYFCTPHKDAGMKGVIHVAGGAGTPTTATTPTTQGGPTPTTATTAPGQPATTTTRAGSTGASTTTTAAAGNGATSTTLAPSVTPTSAPDAAGESTTTAAGQAGGEEAAAGHGSEGGAHKKKEKNSPMGIAFASVSTLLLAAIAGKLLASKS